MNRSAVAILRNFFNTEHTDWDKHLPWAVFCVNTARQESSKFTPFELVHGRVPKIPGEALFPWPPPEVISTEEFIDRVRIWRRAASEFIIAAQERYKSRYDESHDEARDYTPGSLVLVKRNLRAIGRTKKFMPKYIGPFQVVEKICDNTYLVEDVPAMRRRKTWRRFRAHVAQMKPFKTPTETDWCPEEWSTDSDDQKNDTDQPANQADEAGEPEDRVSQDEEEEGPLIPSHSIPAIPAAENVPDAVQTSRAGRTLRAPSYLQEFVCD